MIVEKKETYTLLLSDNPCELFEFFKVQSMHGLNYEDCKKHVNNSEDAYIAGLANYIPKESGDYQYFDERFVYINVKRCTDDINTMGLVMHEFMHHSFWLYEENINKEEEIITWAEEEAYKTIPKIKMYLEKLKQK